MDRVSQVGLRVSIQVLEQRFMRPTSFKSLMSRRIIFEDRISSKIGVNFGLMVLIRSCWRVNHEGKRGFSLGKNFGKIF